MHFPPRFQRQNEYLNWTICASSDYDEDEEDLNDFVKKESFEDETKLKKWIKNKANEAGIQISNNFSNFWFLILFFFKF